MDEARKEKLLTLTSSALQGIIAGYNNTTAPFINVQSAATRAVDHAIATLEAYEKYVQESEVQETKAAKEKLATMPNGGVSYYNQK